MPTTGTLELGTGVPDRGTRETTDPGVPELGPNGRISLPEAGPSRSPARRWAGSVILRKHGTLRQIDPLLIPDAAQAE